MARRCTTQEFEIEPQEKRLMRRKTIKEKCLFVVGKANNLPVSIDIRQLNGSLILTDESPKYSEEGFLAQQNRKLLLKMLRMNFMRSKSYFTNFNQKAELLMRILINLMENYQNKIKNTQNEYKHVRNLFMPWLEIMEKDKINPNIDLNSLVKGAFGEIDHGEDDESKTFSG